MGTSKAPAFMEHRCGTRVSLSARAFVTTTSRETAMACVTNASVTGAFIETAAKPPILSRLTVRLPLARRPALALDGYVVRHDEGGIAVEWLEPGSDATIELMSLAEQESLPFRVPAAAEAASAVSSF
jgi:hypothetical protein